MRWQMTLDDNKQIPVFTCDECGKPESRNAIIQTYWVFKEVNEYIMKDYCGGKCATTAKENKDLQAEIESCHGL